MSPERHQRIRELFDGALEKSEDERLPYLQSACPNDPDVFDAVVRLLKAHAQSEGLLEQGARPLQRIGRYFVTGELGRGAMGTVYEAIDPVINRRIALKIIRFHGITDPNEAKMMRERLFHEARTAGALQHPGIVAVFDVGQEGETAYIAMELVEGPSLQQLLASGWRPDPSETLDFLRQTAAALDYAHQTGVVHRDVKPANIMLHKGVTAKVGDFGIAKITSSRQFTNTGMMMGTPSYMSPEQIEGRPVDGTSDQFALAVLAFELLAGVRPFQSESLAGLAHAIVYGQRPSARVDATLPAAIDKVLHRGMANNPAKRFANCREFVAALDDALKRGRGTEYRREKRRGTRIPALYLGGAALVVLLVAVLLHKGPEQSVQSSVGPQTSDRPIPSPGPAVLPAGLTSIDCSVHDTRLGGEPLGTIRVLGGTGIFAGISQARKSFEVAPQSRLDGRVTLHLRSRGPGFANAPLIGTQSWGNPSSSFWSIVASVMPGENTLATDVHLTAPGGHGTYHILFAFDYGYDPADVASGTDWILHHDVWGDGNDIAQFTADQIAQAQRYGCAANVRLEQKGAYVPRSVAADAITIQVR